MAEEKNFSLKLSGKTFSFEIGKLAQQTNASVVCRLGDTVVLATVVISRDVRGDIDYFPLTVEYEEKLYAAGKIKGSRFIKREGRPSDEAVQTARMIDRALRPLFPQYIVNDVQVVVTVLSYDGENDSDIPGFLAASLACQISDIPFNGPFGALRIGRKENSFIANPTLEERAESDLDLVLAGTADKVIMIEASAKEVSEEDFLQAITFGQNQCQEICTFFEKIVGEIGKPKQEIPAPSKDEQLFKTVQEFAEKQIADVLFGETKAQRKALIYELKSQLKEKILAENQGDEEKAKQALKYFEEILVKMVSDKILQNEQRIGERKLDEVRPLDIAVGVLPRTHGSGYFMRGETQVLTITTLGAPGDEQIIDDMEEEYKKRFMHHYNFPPFSVSEAKPMRGPSRRDIGHGALAEKALAGLIPGKDKFPYTIRLVSEVLGSNGSSSMASVCGSSLSLMDAGVKIPKHVAGIAMGLVSGEQGEYKILTDLQDLEDNEGGMDFKIAGTKDGITAVQLDTKTHGLISEIVEKTLIQAKTGRLQIIAEMEKVIPEARADISKFAPKITTLHINPERIRDVIGPGGKKINEIIALTKVDIDIEDDGTVMITGDPKSDLAQAVQIIENLTREIQVGEIFTGKVTRIFDFGAMVEILPDVEGLVHISELAHRRVGTVEEEVKVGDEVQVKVIEIDGQNRINLSRKALLEKPEGYVEQPHSPRPPRRPFNRGGGSRPRRPRF